MDEIILKNIFQDILEISDRRYQEEVWLGKNTSFCSSYIEVMCRLFDDNNFGDFVISKTIDLGFSPETIIALRLLLDGLENYKELETDAEIIDDKNWAEIRLLASRVISCWCKDNVVSPVAPHIKP